MSQETVGVPVSNGILPEVSAVISDLRAAMKSFDLRQSHDGPPFVTEVTVSFGKDCATNAEVMEQTSLINAACVLKLLLRVEEVSWSGISEVLGKNPVMKEDEARDVDMREYIIRDGTESELSQDGVVDWDTIKQVRSWLNRNILSKDIIAELQIDVEFVRDLVMAASACIDSFAESANGENKLYETSLFRIGVLRFPNISQCFTFYSLDVSAFTDARRHMFDDVDSHGLSLVFKSKTYVPQMYILRSLNAETSSVAIQGALEMYRLMSEESGRNRILHSSPKTHDWPTISNTSGVIPTLLDTMEKSRDAFHNYDVVSVTSVPLQCTMSVAFGDTSEESIKMMEDDTIISLASTHRLLKNSATLSYKEMEHVLHQNMLLHKPTESMVMRYDKIHKDGHDYNCYDSEGSTRKEVQGWIHKLIDDNDLMEHFNMYIDDILRILEATCRHHDTIGELPGQQEYFTRDIVDVVCLRFPDETSEYFQLSHIKISVFADCRRLLEDKELLTYLTDLANQKDAQDVADAKERGIDMKSDDESVDEIENTGNCCVATDVKGNNGKKEKCNNVTIDVGSNDTTVVENEPTGASTGTTRDEQSDKNEEEEEEERDPKEFDTCGLQGEFHSAKYLPRLESLRMLSDKVRKIALKQGYAVFGLTCD